MRASIGFDTACLVIAKRGAGIGIELPFGGVKPPGLGCEMRFDTLLGFSVLKTVAMRHG